MRRKFAGHRRGALEGMGLEIIVSLVIVGGFAAGMYTYLSYSQGSNLGSVDAYVDQTGASSPCFFFLGKSQALTAFTMDQRGHPLSGVSVLVSGLGLSLSGSTVANGTARFGPIAPVLPPDASSGTLSVLAQYTATSLGGSPSAEQASTACTVIR